MELVKGSPENQTERLEKEKRCYELLDRLSIDFWRVDHPDAHANTMEACHEIDRVLDAFVCKNLFLCNRSKTKFYLLVMPGEKVFKAKELSPQIGSSRLSFAKPEYMEEYLDITPGSVSILGLMNDHENMVQLLVDEDVFTGEFVGCHPCINTSSLKIRTKDMFEKIVPAMHHGITVVKLSGNES
ncbi:MAG: prolyl-tRNA synthetase associated domain-containing protein [Eubacteriales bacterium]|nr:prolyl-tRNA synthetase associated domain-containing protein [Eubacteriales bacterium]